MTGPEVLVDQSDGLGLITLNRPKSINALNHSMVIAIGEVLRAWSEDDRVRTVAVVGSGERGLCAGGDIVAIHRDAVAMTADRTVDRCGAADSATGQFWRDEYHLNALISRYPKPYVAVMDGLVMGGGVGLSGHGSHRIVTERSKIGMPEVGIGFVPDVGGTYLLSRAPGEIGTHVGLTTARMNAGDAIVAGFADHFIHTQDIPSFIDSLRIDSVDASISKYSAEAPRSELVDQRHWIDDCYSAETVEEILERLISHGSGNASAAAAEILTKSPIVVKVALRALRGAAVAADLESVLNTEYRISITALLSQDLVEGIRAQVIDKDRSPKWTPGSFAQVGAPEVDAYFASLDGQELGLTPPAVPRGGYVESEESE